MENKQLQKENDELRAHVERLREALHYTLQAWSYDGVSAEHGSTFSEADMRCDLTPAKSLNHIKSQVEEETIKRCARYLMDLQEYGSVHQMAIITDTDEMKKTMPRKYNEQSDE